MGSTVFITGSNRGIGRAILQAFAEAGYDIVAHARQRNEDFEQSMRELSIRNQIKIRPVFFDMQNSDEMKNTIQKIIKDGVQVDVLVNNAGIAHAGLFQMTSMKTVRNVFDVNYFSHLELTQLLVRQMLKKKSGCIINIASIAGMDFQPGNCAYGASKAALIAWTKTLAAEVGQFGVRVNAVAPGLTDTDLAAQMGEKAKHDTMQFSAMKRLALPNEIADVVFYLATEKASYINGQVLRVDGGLI